MGKTNSSVELERSPSQRRFDRARFLRMVGMGLGLSLVPAPLVAWERGATGAPKTAAIASRISDILDGGEYPIGLWWPPPPQETTVERYEEIAQAGFNFVIGGNGVTNDEFNPRALEAAAANNLRFLLTDGRLQRIIRESADGSGARGPEAETPDTVRHLLEHGERSPDPGPAFPPGEDEARRRIRELLELYARYPALAGLSLYDEPSRAMFGKLGFSRRVLENLAPEALPYVNVCPSYVSPASLGTATHEAYLERYLREVKPPLLSFDHYPLLSGREVTDDYFHNWARIRRLSLRFGVPSWVFIQSAGFDGSKVGFAKRRKPDEAEMRWQVNVSLAYGAKGVQYFTYWAPEVSSDAPIRFGEALISAGGEPTPLYGYAKRVNGYLRVVGKVLLPLTSESVVHAGERPLPRGAKAFRKDGYVESVGGSPVILSRFRKPGVKGDRYLFVANRSFTKAARTRLAVSDRVSKVLELHVGTGKFVRVTQQEAKRLRVKTEPGGARLYLLRTGR